MTTPTIMAFIGNVGWQQLIILAVLGLLIFGKRLPEVGRSLGKGIVEFKKGLAGIDDEIDKAAKEPKHIDSSKQASNEVHAESTPEAQPDRPA